MNMTIPAIIGRIGETVYYSTNFTFQQIAELVSPVNSELHTATSIREQLQRALNDNVYKIRDYILAKTDHFFNALVLAVYNGNPLWSEIRFELGDVEYYNVGILSFNGKEKMFPVDGQHRVEGIKKALAAKPELANETIGVILIGHSNTPEGMKKSRRIFSTLNRYAKPVKMGDIIALDEDDVVAIVTRNQLEKNPLFLNDRVRAINSKSIPVNDKRSFTTLITLYECHRELFRVFYFHRTGKLLSDAKLKEYFKYRPNDDEIVDFDDFLSSFWTSFCQAFPELNDYIADDSYLAANRFRSSEEGGNVLFRPISLLPLICAIATVSIRTKERNLDQIMSRYSAMNRSLSSRPWVNIVWSPLTGKMNMKNAKLVRYFMIRFYSVEILTEKELEDMKIRYSQVYNMTEERAIEELEHLFKE